MAYENASALPRFPARLPAVDPIQTTAPAHDKVAGMLLLY